VIKVVCGIDEEVLSIDGDGFNINFKFLFVLVVVVFGLGVQGLGLSVSLGVQGLGLSVSLGVLSLGRSLGLGLGVRSGRLGLGLFRSGNLGRLGLFRSGSLGLFRSGNLGRLGLFRSGSLGLDLGFAYILALGFGLVLGFLDGSAKRNARFSYTRCLLRCCAIASLLVAVGSSDQILNELFLFVVDNNNFLSLAAALLLSSFQGRIQFLLLLDRRGLVVEAYGSLHVLVGHLELFQELLEEEGLLRNIGEHGE